MSHLRRVHVRADDSPSVDAFSRWRVSNPDTVFDSTFRYNAQPLVFETSTANGGTVNHQAASASCSLALDGTPSGSAILQSKRYIPYVPGKSQLIVMTGVLGTRVAGVKKRIGYYDTNNGVFFEQNGTTDLAWTVRTNTSGSPSDANRVAQSSWNLDKLDGTGIDNPSGITLDSTKAQIWVIDLQWLGTGRVRVGFDIGGQIIYVHEFLWANTAAATTVYMKHANLPVRWEITGSSVASMLATCASVSSEGGGRTFESYTFGYTRAVISAGSGVQTYAFSIRPKSTFNSVTNRMVITPTTFDIAVTGVNPVLVEVYYNTTVATPTFTDMDATYSALQVDTVGTPSGGVRVMSFVANATATARNTVSRQFAGRYPLVMDLAGSGYTNMTVYVTGLGGASNCFPGLNWEEIR